jgi:hypothetical protein
VMHVGWDQRFFNAKRPRILSINGSHNLASFFVPSRTGFFSLNTRSLREPWRKNLPNPFDSRRHSWILAFATFPVKKNVLNKGGVL